MIKLSFSKVSRGGFGLPVVKVTLQNDKIQISINYQLN